MKTRKSLLCRLFILSLVAVFGCGGGGGGGDDDDDGNGVDDTDDDADDDGDDTAADDDDADDDSGDDDGTPGDYTIENLYQGDCEAKADPDPATEPHDMVELLWQDGVLRVEHRDAIVNCGAEMEVAASSDGSTLTVTETDVGTPADCICSADLEYDVAGIEPGEYDFVLDGINTGKAPGQVLAALHLTLDQGWNWMWGVPTMDLLKVDVDPPYQAGQDIAVRVSPCYLQDKTSVQTAYRVGYGSYDSVGVYFMVFDQRSLDDPVEEDPTCIFVDTVINIPTPGTYELRANSYNFLDEEWQLEKAASTFDVE